jgi:hypothetical protein
MWNLVSIRLEIVLVSVQDRCTVCTKCTIGSEIILDTPNDTPGHEAQVGARFSPFGIVLMLTQDRCMICTERTTGLEIIFDAPDGTPS